MCTFDLFSVDTHQWIEFPIGLLPWQMDSLKSLEPLEVSIPKHTVSILNPRVIAGIINRKNLRTRSGIKWNNVLWAKKRKREKDITFIMDRALRSLKNRHNA